VSRSGLFSPIENRHCPGNNYSSVVGTGYS
jgi:hypothetical protein